MLLLLLSHTGRSVAATLLACVSLMPALLDAASLLQTDPYPQQADDRGPAPRDTHSRSGENPFWMDDSSPVLARGPNDRGQQQQHAAHAAGRPRRAHHAHNPIAPPTHPDHQKQTLNLAEPSPHFGEHQHHHGGPQSTQRDGALAAGTLGGAARGGRRFAEPTRYERRERAYRRRHTGTGTDYQNDDDDDQDQERERVDDEGGDDDEDNSSADSSQDSRLHGRITPCPGCQRITDDEVAVSETGRATLTGQKLSDAQMKDMLIERIKQQILAKLRLPAAPNATRRHTRLPDPLLGPGTMLGDEAPRGGAWRGDDPDDFYGKTTQVITFATQMRNCPPGRSTACFHFDMNRKVDPLDVRRAQLWVYKQPDSRRQQTLVFSALSGHRRRSNATRLGKELGHRVVPEAQRWVSFDIKRTAVHWLSHPDRNVGLAISCKTCRDGGASPVATDPDKRPFVVIHTTANHQVYRRSTNDCGERSGNRCCREEFYVDFSLIGWDWVTWPPGYRANYCKGTCFVASPILPRYQHTNIMQTFAYTTNNEELSPCCAPRKMRSLSLLYTIDGELIRKHLPNMVVDSCGCT